ncbi:hypothetical protein SMY46_003549 [Cronobacter turicensis]|nr:hypothetical protein [Cronobacter turicensis]ELY4216306.1 hypothetical protein [Cronobacter turicensis]EMA1793142.1 hypothetical protein [Cronobacter turicensis]EMA1802106.1 hypothetical protein [Cronobacter turicensis]EMA1850793.1 hypothetical protein [Cronobacter turicensis]
MISMKEAFSYVAKHTRDLYPSAHDIRLEEIDHVHPLDSEIEVTVSFLVPAESGMPGSALSSIMSAAASQSRIFKKLTINSENGDLIRLQMFK